MSQVDLEEELQRITLELERREEALLRGELELARQRGELKRLTHERTLSHGLDVRELTKESYRARLMKDCDSTVKKLRDLSVEVAKARERRAAIENELLLLEEKSSESDV